MSILKGGKKLEAALAELVKQSGKAHVLKVGFFASAKYPNGTNVAQVVFWNEYGTIRIPSRPFFRNAIAKHSRNWGGTLARLSVTHRFDSAKSMSALGEVIKDQIVQSIVEFDNPMNAQSTKDSKGFDDPLIDTGTMQRSVDYELA